MGRCISVGHSPNLGCVLMCVGVSKFNTLLPCLCVFVLGPCFVMLYFKLFLVLAIISLEEADCFTILSSC